MAVTKNNLILMIVGAAIILGSGYVHGLQTDRWGRSSELLEASKRLDSIPVEFGDWISDGNEIPEGQLKIAEATGYYARRFQNTKTGVQVSVMILCGRPGPISVHPPTVCFVGAGWGLRDSPKVSALNQNQKAEFWTSEFSRRVDGVPVSIKTLWGWSSDGDWSAHENARLKTAGNEFLYKMYVTVPSGGENDTTAMAGAEEFLDEFLPLVDRSLFGDNERSTSDMDRKAKE